MLTKKLVYLCGLLLFLMLINLFWTPLAATPLAAGFTPTPDTQPPQPPPPPPPPPGGGDDDDDDGDPCKQGAIFGTVIDMCTGQPASGMQVLINGNAVTTDWDGRFSLTGLGPGQYNITLQLPDGQTSSVAPSSVVNLECQTNLTVEPVYNTCLPTATPVPPEELPVTGNLKAGQGKLVELWGVVALLGAVLLLIFVGAWQTVKAR